MATNEQKNQADLLKQEGNLAYKERNFNLAIEKYNQAWELLKDITYLNNLSGKF